MQKIGDFILENVPAKTKITNRRQYVVSKFVSEINAEAKKPFSPTFIAIKMSHMNIRDMELFFSTCMDYKHRKGSFGKCFFGALKVKKDEKEKESRK